MSESWTEERMAAFLKDRSNWNRWGPEDELGTLNLISSEKRVRAAGLVKEGTTVSLARRCSRAPGPANIEPLQQFTSVFPQGNDGHVATDFLGMSYHGAAMTHVDALCHAWDTNGMWNGRDPAISVNSRGSQWADIDKWADGIFTRGVLFDVPRHRGVEFVDVDKPISGDELDAIAQADKLEVEPGDALVVYGGREAWEQRSGPWGARQVLPSGKFGPPGPKPGLDSSCLGYIRDSDFSVIVWDMMDAIPFTVHRSIFAFGMALLDNAMLGPLAQACRKTDRRDFLLTFAPLRLRGATGSPVNPIAIL
jgi:kynurenine formamidase